MGAVERCPKCWRGPVVPESGGFLCTCCGHHVVAGAVVEPGPGGSEEVPVPVTRFVWESSALQDGGVVSEYRASHTTGGRGGTTLEVGVTVGLRGGSAVATISAVDLSCPCLVGTADVTVEEALDRLAGRLERVAAALRGRGAPAPVWWAYQDALWKRGDGGGG